MCLSVKVVIYSRMFVAFHKAVVAGARVVFAGRGGRGGRGGARGGGQPGRAHIQQPRLRAPRAAAARVRTTHTVHVLARY